MVGSCFGERPKVVSYSLEVISKAIVNYCCSVGFFLDVQPST